MKNLVQIEDNQVVVSSRDIAKHFGKQHKDVLESVRNILVAENSATKFFMESEHEYRGQKFPMYYMNRDGFSLLVMGFTGKKALEWKIKYIEAFNAMEQQLAAAQQNKELELPKDYPSALRALATQCEVNLKLVEENKILAPKAEFYDAVADSESLTSMGDVAKILARGIGRNKLYKILRENNVLQKDNIPYQRFVDADYFKVIETNFMANGNSVVVKTTYVKQRGIDYIRKLLDKKISTFEN